MYVAPCTKIITSPYTHVWFTAVFYQHALLIWSDKSAAQVKTCKDKTCNCSENVQIETDTFLMPYKNTPTTMTLLKITLITRTVCTYVCLSLLIDCYFMLVWSHPLFLPTALYNGLQWVHKRFNKYLSRFIQGFYYWQFAGCLQKQSR